MLEKNLYENCCDVGGASMGNRLYDDDKIKVIILYLLNELGEAYDFETISEIVVWDGSINYFVFNDCFNQLVNIGAIAKETDDGTDYFSITDRGREALEAVEDRLIDFVKSKIMRSATRLIAFKKSGSTISSHVEKENDGFKLTCTVKNRKFDLMELKLYLDNKEEVDLLQHGFEERAEHIYSSILALLSGDARFLP